MEALNPRKTIKEVTKGTVMAYLATMVADAIIPGSGTGTQLLAAFLSTSATP